MIKLNQLSHRNLETKVQFDIEQEDGTFKKEDFRIVTRDMPQAEFERLLDDVKIETDADFAPYNKRRNAYEKAKAAYEAKKQKFDEENDPESNEQREFTELPPPPFTEVPPASEQHRFHSRIVVKLPDLIDDDGSTPEPTVSTFERLGQNANLVINRAIWQRRTEIDPKK
jgi:hypothetical protein